MAWHGRANGVNTVRHKLILPILRIVLALALTAIWAPGTQALEPASESSAPLDGPRVIVQFAGAPSLGGVAASAQAREQREALVAAALLGGAIEYRYSAAFDGLAVRLPDGDDGALARLRALPGVAGVWPEQVYELDLYATAEALGAMPLWQSLGGRSVAGEGVRIALLDGGIAVEHPVFVPAGYAYPVGYPKGDPTATTPKVIAARAFFRPGDPPVAGEETPLPGLASSQHGTHLASVAAGNWVTPTVNGQPTGISGVAPRAQLMNYRIFYPSASGGAERAYTAEILAAIDAAVQDGAQVLCAGWSSPATGLPLGSPEAQALENAMNAGVVVVTASGNQGPGYGSASRLPGGIERVITVGAQGQPYGRAAFGPAITAKVGPLPLEDVSHISTTGSPYACTAMPAGKLTGRAAVILRGGCTFADKTHYAQLAGASLAIIVNDADEVVDVACSGSYCGAGVITIPTAMVASSLGSSLRAWIDASTAISATISLDASGRVADFVPAWVAPSSARGPAFMQWLKPDLVAPGVAVLSAGAGASYVAVSGTSVAAAHVAGAAALLVQAHPGWGHDDVKAALMAQARLQPDGPAAPVPDQVGVLGRGAGLVDLTHLVSDTLSFDPPSVSLPHLSPGATRTLGLWVRAPGDAITRTLTVTVEHTAGLNVAAPASVVVGAGGAALTVTTTIPSGVSPSDQFAQLTLGDAGGSYHVSIWAHVDAPLGASQVLLIDNDFSQFEAYPDYAAQVINTLMAMGISYAVWDADAHWNQEQTIPSLAVLERYPVVIWLTGDNIYPDEVYRPQYATPLTALDQHLLMAYLDGGGRLLAVGQNLAQASDVNSDSDDTWGRSDLVHGYLGAHWLQGALWSELGAPPANEVAVAGAPGAFLAGMQFDLGSVGDGADNQFSVDEIAPGGLADGADAHLASAVLTAWEAQPVGDGVVGIAKADEPTLEETEPELAYRTLYYSFGWEGINNSLGRSTRADLLTASMDWLLDVVTVTLPSGVTGGPQRLVAIEAEAGSSVGAEIVAYRWQVGEGAGAQVFDTPTSQAQVLLPANGLYPVRVEVTDALGHKAVAASTLEILPGGASTLTGPAWTLGGQPITYAVRALNTEPVTITLALTLPLPTGAGYLRHGGMATYAGGALHWEGPLAPGQEVTATLTVSTPATAPADPRMVATATFSAEGRTFQRSVTTQLIYGWRIVLPILMRGSTR